MKQVTTNPCFQGELMIRRVAAIPAKFIQSAPVNGLHIVGHSETGHHHVVDATAADMFIDKMNEFCVYLKVASETELRHLREFDTHEPAGLPPGTYEVRRAREHAPEGFRRSID